jgi:protein TonB
MFNNLIESSSHRKEFKRRGSFLMFTTATYVLFFVITGVVSIYAYDARLEDQTLEIVTLLPPQEIDPEPVAPKRAEPAPTEHSTGNNNNFDERRSPTASVDQPEVAPNEISSKPNPSLPVRRGVPYRVGDVDSNADLAGRRTGVPSGGDGNNTIPIKIEEPPPAPDPTPVVPRILKVSRILNSQAVSLPKPSYPAMARQIKVQGAVNVQVLIDETGRVISAKAVSGHPFFIPEAQRAAMQARFSPTIIGEQPVKVSGVITYNFVLSN